MTQRIGLSLAEVRRSDGETAYEVRWTYQDGSTGQMGSFADLSAAWTFCVDTYQEQPVRLVRETAEVDPLDALMEHLRDGRLFSMPTPWLSNHSTGALLITSEAHDALFPNELAVPVRLARQHMLSESVAYALTDKTDVDQPIRCYPFVGARHDMVLTVVGEYVVVGLQQWTP